MPRASSTWFKVVVAGVAVGAGLGTYFVLTSNNAAVVPMLYVFMPGIAAGMFFKSRHISPCASALTNAVFFSVLVILVRRVWIGLRRPEPASTETQPPVV